MFQTFQGGKMKKTLTLVVIAGLMLTGCGGAQKAVQPTAAAAVVDAVTVSGVLNLTLDKATDQLEDLGFKVEAVDIIDGKTIMSKKNWQVMSQDPSEGASAAKGSTVKLGVKSLEKIAAEKAAADKAAADKAAAEAAAAAKAAADKAAADKAAADQAAAQAAKPAPVVPAPAPAAPAPAPAPAPAVKAPAAVYYANCTAARQAGAAPIYAGTPGYGKHLDRDGDGIGCDK
jgi:hypothetical protein